MSTDLLARIPGKLFFKALADGEPMAFVILGVVLALLVAGFAFKYMMAQAKQQ